MFPKTATDSNEFVLDCRDADVCFQLCILLHHCQPLTIDLYVLGQDKQISDTRPESLLRLALVHNLMPSTLR